MMERGYICLNRGALHHEFFRRKEHSEFEAWVWLLTEASWKPRTRRVGDFFVELQRGQLAASVRHLATIWKWSAGKVQRFIGRLKFETMIDVKNDTGISVITICNYDKYQTGAPEHDTPTDTANDTPVDTPTIQGRVQQRYTDGYNTEALKHLNNKTSKRAAKPLVDGVLFEKFWAAYPRRKGGEKKAAARKKFEALVAAGTDAEMLIAAAGGYAREQGELGKVGTPYVSMAVVWLNQECWEDYSGGGVLAVAPEINWESIIEFKKKTGVWSKWAGPEPGSIGCKAPAELLQKYGLAS
jgi:hypothetical protein